MESIDPLIARIDAHRARRIGEMLVSGASDEQYFTEPRLLFDLEELDGRELLERYRAKQAKFATAPFDPDGGLLRFYPGGLTVWSGFPGAGKTTILRQFVCHTLHRGSSVFLVSMEEDPRDALVRLAETAVGSAEPNAHQMQWFIDEYKKRFRLWSLVGIGEHLKLLATTRELATQGIRHIVIDSLMCLDIRNDDFEAQRRFANLLAATARAAQVHIHLVAHPRKLMKAGQELDLNDVAGAREIGGVADNIVFVRRDPNRSSYANNAEVTPMCISVRKQRHFGGYLGDVEGWFRRDLRQFTRDQFEGPTRYLPDDAFTAWKQKA